MKKTTSILIAFLLFLPQTKAEVAGAVGDIAVNVATVSPELKPAVDAFNLAMGIIGVKNVGKGVVNFAKQIPENVKTLIRENKSIKTFLTAKYMEWRIAVTNLDNLNVAERELLVKQRQVRIHILKIITVR